MTIGNGIAPADAVQRPAWPLWREIVVYLLLILLAGVSIWFIDRGAMEVMGAG